MRLTREKATGKKVVRNFLIASKQLKWIKMIKYLSIINQND